MNILRIDNTQIDLVVELFDKYRIFYKQASDIAVARAFITARLNNNESVIFVAFNDDKKPIGFTQLYPTYSSMRVSKNWILNDLYVDSDQRKQGVGEKLIKTAMDFAREDGSTFVQLSTAVDNFTAQSLYEQIGFKKQEPDTAFYTYRIAVG